MAHIWACPPSEGDDYIFHCHPIEQKIPKHKRLVDWYKKMLDLAVRERVVIEYKVTAVIPEKESYECMLKSLQSWCLLSFLVKKALHDRKAILHGVALARKVFLQAARVTHISLLTVHFGLFQDILRQANDDGLKTAKELPYFDGDFWPNALEDSIKELDQEEEERKTAAAAAAAETAGKEVQNCHYLLTYVCSAL